MIARLVSTIALTTVLVSCSGGSDVDATPIVVTLEDTAITLSQSTVPTGRIEFETTNAGTAVHEIEVFKGSTTDLPVVLGVADTAGLDLIDEIEDIIPDSTVTLTLDLEPGDYIVICNLPGHYAMGMITKLVVTD